MKPNALIAAAFLAAAAFAVQAAPTAPAAPAAQPSALKGEVLEVLDVPTYTYLRLKTKEGELWAAVPTAPLKKGAQVTLENPMVMENFESKTLKKKFDRILFASLAGQNAAMVSPAAPAAAAQGAAVSPHGSPAASVVVGKIAKATGPGAKTVAEVVATPAPLKDKAVTIRGQVVKFNPGILGKNWVHLQDGSGSASNGTNDILVTTAETIAVGDVISASGTVRTNVDLGSGYVYAVLVEDAKLRK